MKEKQWGYKFSYSSTGKFVYFHIPKCGTSSFLDILEKGDFKLEENEMYLSVKDRRRVEFVKYNKDTFDSYFKFSFIRNPYQRLVSFWDDKIKFDRKPKGAGRNYYYKKFGDLLGYSFSEFISYLSDHPDNILRDLHWKPYNEMLPISKLDFIGRLETAEKDFTLISKRLGLEGHKFPNLNAGNYEKESWKDYYDGESFQIVSTLYSEDIKLYLNT
jgi:hypothetical protein